MYDPVVKLIVDSKRKHAEIYKNKGSKLNVMFYNESPVTLVDHSDYEILSDMFGLPLYTAKDVNLAPYRVWFLKELLMLGWIHGCVQNGVYLEMYLPDIARATMVALMPAIPEGQRQLIKDITVSDKIIGNEKEKNENHIQNEVIFMETDLVTFDADQVNVPLRKAKQRK